MSSTHHNVLLHCVYSTKHRQRIIVPEIRERLYQYMGGVVSKRNATLYEIGGTDDHVHLLVRWNTTGAIANFIRDVKSESSKWVHETFSGHRAFAWQTGYAAFSVSQSQAAKVTKYIRRQEEHHRTQSFQDELRQLLDAHGIAYDEKYLWD